MYNSWLLFEYCFSNFQICVWYTRVLYENQFTGYIPKEIGGLKKLEILDLRVNNLIGTIPAEIGQMQSLKHLWVRFTFFSIYLFLGSKCQLTWIRFCFCILGYLATIDFMEAFLMNLGNSKCSLRYNLTKILLQELESAVHVENLDNGKIFA